MLLYEDNLQDVAKGEGCPKARGNVRTPYNNNNLLLHQLQPKADVIQYFIHAILYQLSLVPRA